MSGRPTITIAKFDPAGKLTVRLVPSSAEARELCSSAPHEGLAATTRRTTSCHLRWSSPWSVTAGVVGPAAAATAAAEAGAELSAGFAVGAAGLVAAAEVAGCGLAARAEGAGA